MFTLHSYSYPYKWSFFADKNFAEELSKYNYSNLLLGIPIHSDYSGDHDYITQVQGSYSETLKGLYNLATVKIPIELRVVINKINYLRLPQISNFIYKNLPFVDYISFMGLEDTGYSVKIILRFGLILFYIRISLKKQF